MDGRNHFKLCPCFCSNGPAPSKALGQGSAMVAAIWGVFVWKEVRGLESGIKLLLAFMFIFFRTGLTFVTLARSSRSRIGSAFSV
jgi:hypothetical protein